MEKETILSVNNLHVDFHTYAGEVKAIRDVNFELKKVRLLQSLVNLVQENL